MKSTILFLFLAFVVAVNAQNATTTQAPTSTNATTTTTATTTTKPTTAASTTVTTQNATTVTNQTVTTKPTTHEMTTNNESNTTPAVTTAQTTTLAPTPPPAEPQFFKVQDKEGGPVCILLNVTFEFKFEYKDEKNKSEVFFMSMPKGAAGSGKCNTSSPYLTITFGPHDDKLTMHFAQKDSSTYIENVSLNFTMDTTFPGITVEKKESSVSKPGATFYSYRSDSAFTCQSNQTMALSGDNVDVTVTTIDMELEAFRTSNSSDFNTNKVVNCPADSVTSNIVPIAVGAALAALVVIVLIAYLISRNRNKRGYESV